MFRHVLLMTVRPDAEPGQITGLVEALRGLPAQIPEIISYQVGEDLGLRDGNADLALVAEFADEGAWRAYLAHSAHRAVVAEHVEPVVVSRQSAQFLTD